MLSKVVLNSLDTACNRMGWASQPHLSKAVCQFLSPRAEMQICTCTLAHWCAICVKHCGIMPVSALWVACLVHVITAHFKTVARAAKGVYTEIVQLAPNRYNQAVYFCTKTKRPPKYAPSSNQKSKCSFNALPVE